MNLSTSNDLSSFPAVTLPESGASDHAISPAVQFHDEMADEWGDNYERPSFGKRAELLFELIDEAATAPGAWLDAGCGSGVLSLGLAERGHRVVGVDGSPLMIQAARSAARHSKVESKVSFQEIASVESLPWEAETFDGVLSSSVLEYLDEPERCLSELSRVLKPGGVAVISVPNRSGLLRRLQKWCYALTATVGREPRPRYLAHSRHDYTLTTFQQQLELLPLETTASRYYGARFPDWLSRQSFGGSLLMVVARKTESAAP